jgi:hypothetical protein
MLVRLASPDKHKHRRAGTSRTAATACKEFAVEGLVIRRNCSDACTPPDWTVENASHARIADVLDQEGVTAVGTTHWQQLKGNSSPCITFLALLITVLANCSAKPPLQITETTINAVFVVCGLHHYNGCTTQQQQPTSRTL